MTNTERTSSRQRKAAQKDAADARRAENVEQAASMGITFVQDRRSIWPFRLNSGRVVHFYPRMNEWILSRGSGQPTNWQRWHGDFLAFAAWLDLANAVHAKTEAAQ